jgi:hypothetical protein
LDEVIAGLQGENDDVFVNDAWAAITRVQVSQAATVLLGGGPEKRESGQMSC